MKRTSLLITVIIVLLVLVYLLYDKYYQKSTTDLHNLVPENASLVYENKKPSEAWNKLIESEIWGTLGQIPELNTFNTTLAGLDSMSGNKGLVANSVGNGILISVHKISNTQFDAVLYLDLSNIDNQKGIGKILDELQDSDKLTTSNRTYQNFKITEISENDRSGTFSYLIHDNLFIGSFTSFLIEDVVRLINSNYKNGFFSKNNSLVNMPKLSNDDGNVYIETDHFNGLINTFLEGGQDIMENFSRSMFYDLSVENNKVLFSGFTQTDEKDFLHTLLPQNPQKNNFQYYVSNKASHFYQIAFESSRAWHDRLKKYWQSADPRFLQDRIRFSTDHDYDFDNMFTWLGKGIGLVNLPSSSPTPHRLVIMDTRDITEAMNQLNRFSESLATVQNDSVYIEKFSGLTIRELKVGDFPMYTFGPLFTGFEETFYTSMDDFILFAESIQTIKELVSDIENENTLGRSVSYNKFDANTLQESNFKLVVNTSGLWGEMVKKVNPHWEPFFQENANSMRSLRYMSFDFSALDDSFYSSIAVQYEKPDFSPERKLFETDGLIAFNYPFITKPYVVKSHVDNSREVFLQDSANYVMLVSGSGEKLWQRKVDGPVVSDVQQVDYYANGKLQYFFTTERSMHIIDRLGNNVEEFPMTLDYTVKYASVIDYDKSKRYRFIVADERGNLYLYNKEGVNLEGWTPHRISGRLAFQPFHLRIRGRDVIVAIQNDGTVNVVNRRGENMPGFPVKVEGRFEGQAHVQPGADLSKTVITILSKEGRLIKFNLTGEVVSTNQLYRPTQESAFNLVVDALDKTYVIARQDLNRLVIMDRDKNELLSKDYLSDEELIVQYYNFSGSNQIYAVTDPVQGFTYIYNMEGNLISSRPIDSDQAVGLMYYESQRKYEIFAVTGNTFRRLSF